VTQKISLNRRGRRFLKRFHQDETGPNTVEWVLLIIIALILLIAIFLFAKFVIDKFKEKQNDVQEDAFIND